jgi:hypothetical protein
MVGVLVSPYIGAKVFLNSIQPLFGFSPTKVNLVLAFKDSNSNIQVEHIQTKGSSPKRMGDYDV